MTNTAPKQQAQKTTAPKQQAQKTCEFGSHGANEIHHHDSWGGLVKCLGSERDCSWCGSYIRYQK